MLPYSSVLEDEVRPLRRVEYDRLVDLGLLDEERVELLYGRIVRMVPQGDEHAGTVTMLNLILTVALAGRAIVRIQSPLVMPDESEPEPDVAVVPLGDVFTHPDRALLVVEVSATSQAKDRGPKAALYAAAAVPEFWLVDLLHRRVERYRRPLDGRYAESSLHDAADALALVAFPDVEVALARILPT